MASITLAVPRPGNAARPTKISPPRSGSPGDVNGYEPGCDSVTANAPSAGIAPESNTELSATIVRSAPVSLSNTTVWPAITFTVEGSKPSAVTRTCTASRVGCAVAALAVDGEGMAIASPLA